MNFKQQNYGAKVEAANLTKLERDFPLDKKLRLNYQ